LVVNNGNSIILTANRKGEISYCSDSIKGILGYDADEVLGLGYWKLTEDPELSHGIDRVLGDEALYHKLSQEGREYANAHCREFIAVDNLLNIINNVKDGK
jgi:PAS domain S-box-containing protein